MSSFSFPAPVLDARERDLIKRITHDYERFRAPGAIAQAGRRLGRLVRDVTPASVHAGLEGASREITEWEYFQQAIRIAADGFEKLNKIVAIHTLRKEAALEA